MASITVKQKEAKRIKFTITEGGAVVDVSSATFHFAVKRWGSDASYALEVLDADFDKTEAAVGIVYIYLTEAALDLAAAAYVAELRIFFSASNIDKSADITFTVERAVIT